MKKVSIILFLILNVLLGCDPQNDQIEKINFNGILITDRFGNTVGGNDDGTDWKLNDSWNQKENSLFIEKRDNYCTSNINDFSIRAYPNPCSDLLNLGLNFPDGYNISLRIVDRYYNLLFSYDQGLSKQLAIAVTEFNVKNDTIRVYYKFLGTNCELIGHGDIKIN